MATHVMSRTARSRPALAAALIGALSATAGVALAPPAVASILVGCSESSNAQDLNGDGFDDAAVGDPYATVNGRAEAGTVTVLFGDADGRIGEGARRLLTQADVGETPEAGDHFGWDLQLGITDTSSTCADLLIGSPGEDLDGKTDAGLAHLVSFATDAEGNPSKMIGNPLTQADGEGTVEAGDQFGTTVALQGTPGDEERFFVIGAPGEDIGGATDAGAVNVIYGVYSAELVQGNPIVTGVRVPGVPEAGDRFGASLTMGHLSLGGVNGRSIIIGAPGDTVAGRDGAGSVTVVHLGEEYESASLITQNSPGVPGGAEAGDQFGFSLALSPYDGNNSRTLAVGSPTEDDGSVADTGSVTMFTNKSSRLVPRTAFSQDTSGVPGVNEAGDRFGHSLAFQGRSGNLWVGVPSEDLGSVADAGVVQPVEGWGTEKFPLRYRPD